MVLFWTVSTSRFFQLLTLLRTIANIFVSPASLSGTIRPVRRSFYDPASAPGQGWQWEWENDAGTWTPYDMEVAIAIETAHHRQQPCLDLTPLGFCYLIDFQNMTQVC